MKYICGAYTDAGIHKKTNQDSLAIRIADTGQGQIAFAILCDGMGGLAKGELASATVIKMFTDWFENDHISVIKSSNNMDAFIQECNRIIQECNRKLYQYGKERKTQLGTTMVMCLVYENHYYVANIGDSRMYLINMDYCNQITEDQSLVAREVRAGRLTEEAAEKDSRRNILLQCIGVTEEVKPEYYSGNLAVNNMIMLCSDGFRHELSKKEINDYLNPVRNNNENDITNSIQTAIQIIKKRKEKDNISALSIKAIG